MQRRRSAWCAGAAAPSSLSNQESGRLNTVAGPANTEMRTLTGFREDAEPIFGGNRRKSSSRARVGQSGPPSALCLVLYPCELGGTAGCASERRVPGRHSDSWRRGPRSTYRRGRCFQSALAECRAGRPGAAACRAGNFGSSARVRAPDPPPSIQLRSLVPRVKRFATCRCAQTRQNCGGCPIATSRLCTLPPRDCAMWGTANSVECRLPGFREGATGASRDRGPSGCRYGSAVRETRR